MDHDQRFKTLLELRLADLLALVLGNERAQRYDCQAVEWLQQEIYSDPPEGQRLTIDIAGRVPVRVAVNELQARSLEPWLVLIHAEIESQDSVAPLRKRIYDYRHELRHKYNIPVLSIGVYLSVGLEGLGWDAYTETYDGEEILRFRFPYIGLPGLQAFDFVRGDNLLGVALSALMAAPPDRLGELKLEALERVTTAPIPETHRHLLAECIDAYLPLEGPQLQDFHQRLITRKEGAMIQRKGVTFKQQGQQEGREGLLLGSLRRKFGPLPETILTQLRQLTEDQMIDLNLRIGTAQSLAELGLDAGPTTEASA